MVGEHHERGVAAKLKGRLLAAGGTALGQHATDRVEPVNDSWRTSGASVNTSPITAGSPHTRFITPGGKPASSKTSNRSTADSGVCSAGLSTTVFPAATAGASLRVVIELGKFQGVMHATTPRGRQRT